MYLNKYTLIFNFLPMKYYINGQEVTKEQIKVQSYIEEYRFTLVKIFIIKYFQKNKAKVVASIALILAILFSIWLNASAEEITLESIIEKEEVTDQDIDKFIEIIEGTQLDYEITPENIERSDKSYEEFMKEWERLHQIKYEEQRKREENIKKKQIKWNGRLYNVQVWNDRIKTMKKLWYSDTRILDLLAIMNMECWSYKWDCFNWNDIWPMQINKIHKEQYNKSWEYYNKKDWGKLFEYQIKYANQLVESYEAKNCKPEYVKKYWIWKTYNQKRWRCVAFHYNWHPKNKFAYNKLGWERRQIISDLIF